MDPRSLPGMTRGTPMTTKKLILIIDDEVSILQTLKASLEDENYLVETLEDGKKAIDVIGKITPDVVLLDISMPGCNGMDLLPTIKQNYPEQKIIMISGFGTIPLAIDALKNGASDFIEKPLNLDDVLAKITTLTTHKSNTPAITPVHDFNASGITGASTLFCELMHHIKLIAPLETPVIIYGPHGSGKTVIAHYMHTKSSYASQPCVVFNCASHTALPDELFHGTGSLILKNIESLNLDDQRKLLNHLESKTNIRIIALSTPKLFSLVQKGLFNASLFCKLNTTPCEIPPLNKRRYDIPLLVSFFVTQINTMHNKAVSLTSDAIRLLRNYNWVGDVTELKNILTTTILTTRATIIDAPEMQKHLPERDGIFVDEQMYSRFNSLDHATEIFQRQYIKHLLKKHNYNTLQLAEFLQIPVASLNTTMIKLQLDTHV